MKTLLVLITVGLLGCASSGHQSTTERTDGSGVVIRGTELSGGSLLDALRRRYSQMSVASVTGQCPQIVFRGPRSGRFQGNPAVYVDGTLMNDTCILQQLGSSDIDYVELYPSGITSKVGVQRNSFGVILVYRLKN